MKPIYLSLGANLGDPQAQIRLALEFLRVAGCKVHRVSSFYKTEPVDFHDQPWFVNCVAEIETEISPRALLHMAKSFERRLRRIRRMVAKGPREIDIDILFYGDLVVNLPTLEIPHPRLAQRRFVLVPLNELAPKYKHPITGKTVSTMLRETQDAGKVIRLGKNR